MTNDGVPWMKLPPPAGADLMLVRVDQREGRTVITGLCLEGDDLCTSTLREVSLSRLAASLGAPPPQTDRPRLRRPDGSDPDGFYRQVAGAYSSLVCDTSRPAKAMAEEAGVPVATVHRWIHEARRRGFLPVGRQGRSG